MKIILPSTICIMMKSDDCKALWQTLVSINFSDDDGEVKDI